ncbi:MAG: 2-oxoacid:acceptor oxidoreductase family protein [Bryobacteraceae bacterium]
MLTEIRIAGFGGQGVILATHILGRAASVHEGRYATMTQSYGPEARGGAASASLIVSDEPVLYPYVTHPDVLVVMSQEAYTRFTPEVKPGGFLLVEEDLVRLDRKAQGLRIYGIPATRFAEELGKKMVLNVIMTGFLCAVTKALSVEATRKSVSESVPARFRDLNLQAFDRGVQYGEELLVRGPIVLEEFEELVTEGDV